MRLEAQNVDKVMRDCLFKPEEIIGGKPPADAVIVEGVRGKFGLHKARLESHRGDVESMLEELPEQFMIEKGGGWSFLNACMTRDGNQWGEHRDMNALFVLGQGLGVVKCQLPREMWDILPGGVPYYSVTLERNMQPVGRDPE